MNEGTARNVFLTGASAGIGLATARLLCARGYRVWGTSREAARLADIDGLHPVTLDLEDLASLEQRFRDAEAQAGGFDVLINNAGFAAFAPLLDLPVEVFEREWRAMVAAPLRLAQLAAPTIAARRGVIINVSSLAAEFPIPCMGGYSAAKAALASLSATLRHEFASIESAGGPPGARVVDLQPGDIATEFNAHLRAAAIAEQRTPWAAAIRNVCERHCAAGPAAETVARDIARAIEQRPGSPLRSGAWLQVRLGPLALRLLPVRLRERILWRYYQR